jgi:PKD domain
MSGERGEVNLVGVLVGGVLALVILGATFSLFERGTIVSRTAQTRADQQERVRDAVDGITKQLRNLASPTPDQPNAVDRATGRDLIFKTVDPVGPNTGANGANVKRMRYCLDTAGRLWRQQQRWTGATVPAMPGATNCPGIGWDAGDVVVAETVVNDDTGEPAFRFNSTTLSAISQIRVSLLVDLNGSASSDPEGNPLTYIWKDNGTEVGRGIVLRYQPAKGNHSISLEVQDSSGLSATQGPTTVTL